MADENPIGFEIDGEVYEVPTLDSFDMDEAQLLYDLSGVTLEDFIAAPIDASDEQKVAHYKLQIVRIRNPQFKRAFVHIAYRRKHQDYDFEVLDKGIGKMNAADISVAVLERGDGQDPSTSSPKPLNESSSESGISEKLSSGIGSGSDSERPELTLAPTGTSPLVTFSDSLPTPETLAS